MGYPTPKINDNGQGIWDTSAPSTNTAFGSPVQGSTNALGQVGSNTSKPGGTAGGSRGNDMGGQDQGTGPRDKPSPDQSLLDTTGNASPDQLSGPRDKPSPDQSLLNTTGKKSMNSYPVRKPSFGGMEKGVQIP